jgi:hypothetical protein
MSLIFKCTIKTASILKPLYTAESGKVVGDYLTKYYLPHWAANTKGVDDKGAHEAIVV